jgi:hypothetical protein
MNNILRALLETPRIFVDIKLQKIYNSGLRCDEMKLEREVKSRQRWLIEEETRCNQIK